MEQIGSIVNGTVKVLKVMTKILMYLLWGVSRILETVLHETNGLLKRILEKKQ